MTGLKVLKKGCKDNAEARYHQKKDALIYQQTTAVRVVGIMGVCRGVGTTHMALLLANCMANGMKIKTAVVEYNDHNDYLGILKESGVHGEIRQFTYGGIDFYRNVQEKQLSELIACGYDVVIVDMQYGQNESMREFLRCNIRIVVSGLNLWQIGALKTFIKNENLSPSLYICASHCCNPDLAKAIQKEYKVLVKEIPTERDPFRVSAEGLYEILHITKIL